MPASRSEAERVDLEPNAVDGSARMLKIVNRRGLHARAAAKFASLAERYSARLVVTRDGQAVSANSIMGLMMLGAGQGTEVELSGIGEDASAALDALSALVAAGFHEDD